MKAIIISDEKQIIESLDNVLVESGFDTIIYRWLLKALDNIEEIRPDVVIVSAKEYPRHWKTLTQFIASGIGGDKTGVFLFTQNSLNPDDLEKAKALGVKGFVDSIELTELNKFKNKLSELYPSVKTHDSECNENDNSRIEETSEDIQVPTVSDIQENHKVEFDSDSASIIFEHPETHKMVLGFVKGYLNGNIDFLPENPDILKSISAGSNIDLLTLEIDNKCCNYKAKVNLVADQISISLESEIHG